MQCSICGYNKGTFGSLVSFDFGLGNKIKVCYECNQTLFKIKNSRNKIEFRKNKYILNNRISESIDEKAKMAVDSFCMQTEANINERLKSIKKICPICSTVSIHGELICNECGYKFNINDKFDYKQMAAIVNERKTKSEEISGYEYEYESVIVYDNYDGSADNVTINSVLTEYSINGWRLHTMYANELGRTSSGVSVLGIANTTNATICQQIMVFERCVKK